MKKRRRLLQRKLLEAKKCEVIQKLKEAKIQGRLLERRYVQKASEERIAEELKLVTSSQKKETRSIAIHIQTLEVNACLYCGKTSHKSVICLQPHSRCTKLKGCYVEDMHPWFYPRTKCPASPSYPSSGLEGNKH